MKTFSIFDRQIPICRVDNNLNLVTTLGVIRLMRKRIYEIIEPTAKENTLSKIYDIGMLITISLSIIPLAFKQDILLFNIIDKVATIIFIFDYIFRWITADYLFENKSPLAFLKYPFTIMALIDLISILPSLTLLNNGVKVLRIFRMIRAMKVFRIFKTMRYSKSIQIISRVISSSRDSLVAVCIFATGYILVSALIIFNVEPDTFATFFDAIYWATVSLTTVGYGDIYPVSTLGRIITMISSVFGIAIVALPAGIITAGYMNEIEKK